MRVVVRFAPSPTGYLHAGNARVALLNALLALREGGCFILRLDDTDQERSTEAYAQAIREDLHWLGLSWDREERQSARMAAYEAAFARLLTAGRIYPCYETEEELDLKRAAQRSAGKPPLYDRAALKLADADRAALEAQGRKPHWRFLLEHQAEAWTDMVQGDVAPDLAHQSDPVVRRADGSWLYMLPSVVDDLDMSVTHVIRGVDHMTNTAIQGQMIRALDGTPPSFGHLPLMRSAEGKLSKRKGAMSLRDLAADGIEPLAVASYLASLGTSHTETEALRLHDLAQGLDFSALGRGEPVFDVDILQGQSARLLHRMPLEAVRDRLADLGLTAIDTAFWEAVRPNLTRLDDAVTWWMICRDTLIPAIEPGDQSFMAEAVTLLPHGDPDAHTWAVWTEALKQATGRKGKVLFLPLRRALTGLDHGPDLRALLPLLGREKIVQRLQGKRA